MMYYVYIESETRRMAIASPGRPETRRAEEDFVLWGVGPKCVRDWAAKRGYTIIWRAT
jgi:hypothetical protein